MHAHAATDCCQRPQGPASTASTPADRTPCAPLPTTHTPRLHVRSTSQYSLGHPSPCSERGGSNVDAPLGRYGRATRREARRGQFQRNDKVRSNAVGRLRVAVLARLGVPEVWATHRTGRRRRKCSRSQGRLAQLTRLQSVEQKTSRLREHERGADASALPPSRHLLRPRPPCLLYVNCSYAMQ